MTKSGQKAVGSGQWAVASGPKAKCHGRRWTGWLMAAVAGVAVAAKPLFAQCPMCYASASAMGPQAKHALNVGILLLILPVASIIVGIATFTYRNRESK